MTTLHQNHRMIVSSACVALLLSPLVQAVLAQDAGASARARAEVMAKEMQARGTITRLSQGLLSVFGEANRALIGVTTSSGNCPSDGSFAKSLKRK